MRVHCITINNFGLIPVTRFILQLFAKKFDTTITECMIKGQYEIEGIKKKRILGKFENTTVFNNQSALFKARKYLQILWALFAMMCWPKAIVYSPDYQVLAIALWLKKNTRRKGWKIIYHQFETVEWNRLSARDTKFWTFILSNADLIDLCVFPEKHRMAYFLEQTKGMNDKVMLFANTCRSAVNHCGPVHDKLLSIPPNALVAAHVGNVGLDHYFKKFLDIIDAAKEEDIYFVVIGRHSKEVIDEFKNVTNPKMVLLEEVPHRELAGIYPKIDYGFILYKGVDLNFEYCAPNKLYEYWSYGVPVLGHQLAGLKSVFNHSTQGQLLDFNQENVISVVIDILKSGKPNKKALLELFKKEFSIESELSRFEKKIQELSDE